MNDKSKFKYKKSSVFRKTMDIWMVRFSEIVFFNTIGNEFLMIVIQNRRNLFDWLSPFLFFYLIFLPVLFFLKLLLKLFLNLQFRYEFINFFIFFSSRDTNRNLVLFILNFIFVFLVLSLSLNILILDQLWLSTNVRIFCILLTTQPTKIRFNSIERFKSVIINQWLFFKILTQFWLLILKWNLRKILLKRCCWVDNFQLLKHFHQILLVCCITLPTHFHTIATLSLFFMQSFHKMLNNKMTLPTFLLFNLIPLGNINQFFLKLTSFLLDGFDILFQLLIVNAFLPLILTPSQVALWDTSIHSIAWYMYHAFTAVVDGIQILFLFFYPFYISFSWRQSVLHLFVFILHYSIFYLQLFYVYCSRRKGLPQLEKFTLPVVDLIPNHLEIWHH